MKRYFIALGLAASLGAANAADLPTHQAPDGAEAYIIFPADQARVSSPVTVRFGLAGMGIAPAGVDKANTGHHHLLINVDELPAAGKPIPADKQHLHFGGGQTETTLELAPGTYTLQLNLGDLNHVPFNPPVVSQKITIHVE